MKTLNNSRLVSIIMPAFNAQEFIKESIESVLIQTYKNFELLVIDDFSTDNTADIVEMYSNLDSRIQLIRKNSNSGVADTRNVGISCAKGRFIAFLDSDDLWTKDKLHYQVNYMINNGYGFTFSNYEIIDETSNKKNKIVFAPGVLDYKKFLKGSKVGCLTVVVDLSVIQLDDMKSIGHEDYLAWLNILKNHNGYGLAKTLGYYRDMSNTLSGNKFKAARWQYLIYRKELDLGIFKSLYYFSCYALNALTKEKRCIGDS